MTRRRALLSFVGLALALLGGLTLPAVAVTPLSAPVSSPAAATRASSTDTAALTATAPTAPASDSFIFVGTGGLTWTDVDEQDTPHLWQMLRDGSSAALTVRSVFTNTCPIDGWLSLSAGNRAAAAGPEPGGGRRTTQPCVPAPMPVAGAVPGWSAYVDQAEARKFGSVLGTLGGQAAAADQCIQAVGPGAAVAAADQTGRVERYAAWDPGELTGLVSGCRLTVVDVGSLRDPENLAEGEDVTPELAVGSRLEQARAIDTRIGQVLEAAPSGADVMVGSLSDAGRSERLRLVVAQGPDFGPGTLLSPSTRQDGLVQSSDLTVSLLAAVGAEVPAELGGAALRRKPAEGNSPEAARDRLTSLVDYDDASHDVHALVPPFFNVFVGAQLVIYVFVAIVWKRHFGSLGGRARMLNIVRAISVAAAAVPASTFLANLFPWWRFTSPMLAVVASVALFVVLITAFALLGPWGRSLMGPLAAVSAVTMLVLATDVMTGSTLQLSSLLGLQPVVGGRFYGMGNVTFAIFATSALLLCIAVSHWLIRAGRTRLAAAVVAAIGLAAVVVDGSPSWGADGGGPPALLPALAFFVLTILGIRLTWKKAVLILGVTAGLFLLVGFLDWLRPTEDRSHLGRFIQAIFDGGALDIVTRKLNQNIDILFGNYRLSLLVPVALIFVIYVLARPTSWGSRALQRSFDRAPTLRPGLIALLMMLTIGFAINDSGVAIPAVAATVAVPLVVAVSVRTLEDEARAASDTRIGRLHA